MGEGKKLLLPYKFNCPPIGVKDCLNAKAKVWVKWMTNGTVWVLLNNMAEEPKVGKNTGNMGKGRPKGSPNKTTKLLKDAILKAAQQAGGGDEEGIVRYLAMRAQDKNPAPFMALLGKVLPMQVTGDPDAPLDIKITIGGDDG